MDRITLRRTAGVGDAQWTAISDAVDRLNRSVDADDPPAIVGGSKELCECVAKVVLVARTEADEGLDYPAVVGKAHSTLGRQPGHGDVADGAIRNIVQGAKTIVSSLAEMRNKVGTGHGRATAPVATAEHASLAVNATRLWCEWALDRLAVVLENSVDALIAELSGSHFTKGELGRRLAQIGLDTLSDEDMERLGRAVAQRGGYRGTFVVKWDGVDAALRNPASFPAAYRRGLVSGLFFDHDGYINTTPNRVNEAARLLQSLDDASEAIWLSEDVVRADLAYGFDVSTAPEIVAAIEAEAIRFAEGSPGRDGWLHIRDRFTPAVQGGDDAIVAEY
ncbi:MAG: abortive infection family protein [Actinomycetota bacterium]